MDVGLAEAEDLHDDVAFHRDALDHGRGVQPILTLDQGEARLVATIRSRRRAVVRLCELALAAGAIESLLICGTRIEAIAEMEELLAAQYPGTIRKDLVGSGEWHPSGSGQRRRCRSPRMRTTRGLFAGKRFSRHVDHANG